jgi:hypothetical protein
MIQEEENEVPRASKFYSNFVIENKSDGKTLDLMTQFAKLHVQAALEAASYNAKLASYDNKANKPGTSGFTTITVNDVEWRPCSESILNAYPLENVK